MPAVRRSYAVPTRQVRIVSGMSGCRFVGLDVHPGQARVPGQVNGSSHPQQLGARVGRHRHELTEGVRAAGEPQGWYD
ncbi:hypothetical protein Aple_033200 [Acrocarpospora pleiomorpha]|uniref:Uncharacterized protein n=2 Tax=Acrocarpospora pleiomorpha TaxID=90975 RepID=A0A5M3XGM0_9ACTN|nr:hypothetical protein Aple_033200 [Acrocarpospora pleiomorpha]